MKTRLAAALLALPLLAFDCGGSERQTSPFGMDCKLLIRGAGTGANEDLWCIVSAVDYQDFQPPTAMWAFELVAYRGMTQVGGGVGIFLPGRPALSSPYGWTDVTTNVDSGSAMRAIGDATAVPSTYQETHEAMAPMQPLAGTGAMSITFTRIPPPGATGQQLVDVHGTLSGTLSALDGVSPPLTFAATF